MAVMENEKKILLAGAADAETSFPELDDKMQDPLYLVQEALTEEESGSSFFLFRLPIAKWKTFFLFLGISLGLIFHWKIQPKRAEKSGVVSPANDINVAEKRLSK